MRRKTYDCVDAHREDTTLLEVFDPQSLRALALLFLLFLPRRRLEDLRLADVDVLRFGGKPDEVVDIREQGVLLLDESLEHLVLAAIRLLICLHELVALVGLTERLFDLGLDAEEGVLERVDVVLLRRLLRHLLLACDLVFDFDSLFSCDRI